MNEILNLVEEIVRLKYPMYKLMDILSSIEHDVVYLSYLSKEYGSSILTIDSIKENIYSAVRNNKFIIGMEPLDVFGFFERDSNGYVLFNVTLQDGTVVKTTSNLTYTDSNGNVIAIDDTDVKDIKPVFTTNLNQPLYELFFEKYHNIFNAYSSLILMDSFRTYVKNILKEIENSSNLTEIYEKYIRELELIKQSLQGDGQ